MVKLYLWRIERYIRGKQAGFYRKSRTLSHLVAFEEHMADKALSVSQKRREVSCWRCCTACNSLRRSNDSAIVNNSLFIQPKKQFISEWYSLITMRLGVLSWEKLNWNRDNNGRIERIVSWGVEDQLLIPSSCLSPVRVNKLQTFINFCLKVGHSYNLSSCERYKSTFSTSWSENVNDRSTTVVVLISGAFGRSRLITRGVYIDGYICISQCPR